MARRMANRITICSMSSTVSGATWSEACDALISFQVSHFVAFWSAALVSSNPVGTDDLIRLLASDRYGLPF